MFIFIVIKVLSFSDNKAMNKQQTNNIKNIVGFFRKRNFWILLLLNVDYDCGTQFILIYWSIIYVENLALIYLLCTPYLCLRLF